MALPVEQQVRYWSIAAVAFFAIMWFLGDAILPFVLGTAVAYFLDPTADWLERRGFSRVAAVFSITFAGVLVFLAVLILVLPVLVRQLSDLITALPDLVRSLQNFVLSTFPNMVEPDSAIQIALSSFTENLKSRGLELVQAALKSVSSLFSIVTLLVITPVVAFYQLLDWDKLIKSVDDLLPRDHAPTIRLLAHQVDRTLAGFIRGQGTVCVILGSFYAVALVLAGLNFGLVVGIFAGALTFIPYIGALVGGALAIGLALFQFWDTPVMIVVIALIFMAGQMVEGNFLTPKLVGNSVGLHPVWLLLSLSAFGALFGLVGMLVAVPVAAVIGVFIRFFTGEYKRGRLYRGLEALDASDSDDDQNVS